MEIRRSWRGEGNTPPAFYFYSRFFGDQLQVIEALVEGFQKGNQFQTLLGVTDSGKTFIMANIIQALHNGEFKEFFPENAVEYFVS